MQSLRSTKVMLLKYSFILLSMLTLNMSNSFAESPPSDTVLCRADVNIKLWDGCYGTFIDQFKVSYSGNWNNGNLNGQGVIDFPDGRKYIGSIKNSNISGKGVVYDSNGIVITSGNYRGGQFIESDGNTKPLPTIYTNSWKADEKRKNEVEDIKRSLGPAEKAKFGDGTPEHQTCFKFGFVEGTSAYSDCRLKLEINKQEANQRQAAYELEQQRYQERLATAKREKERQQGLALLNYAAALGSSTSPTLLGGVADANRAMGWAPPEPPKLQPFMIQGPKGMTTCTVVGNMYNCF